MTSAERRNDQACHVCCHRTAEHSREPGVGCLHRIDAPTFGDWDACYPCPCTEPGDATADQ